MALQETHKITRARTHTHTLGRLFYCCGQSVDRLKWNEQSCQKTIIFTQCADHSKLLLLMMNFSQVSWCSCFEINRTCLSDLTWPCSWWLAMHLLIPPAYCFCKPLLSKYVHRRLKVSDSWCFLYLSKFNGVMQFRKYIIVSVHFFVAISTRLHCVKHRANFRLAPIIISLLERTTDPLNACSKFLNLKTREWAPDMAYMPLKYIRIRRWRSIRRSQLIKWWNGRMSAAGDVTKLQLDRRSQVCYFISRSVDMGI